MARPGKGLQTLIRLSKFNVDERRRVLTALQNQEEKLLHDIVQSEVDLRKEQELAASDAVGIGFSYGSYHQLWMNKRANLFSALAGVRRQIEIARDELSEAFREQKTYEITLAERERREREEENRKEQIFLDEIGMQQHLRKDDAKD
jgi:flagellar protein FliJ